MVAGARCANRSNSPQGNSGTRGWHPPEAQRCGSPRPAEGDLQNGSGRRGPYISVRSCACSFPQRDHHARKGLLRAIADDEASGIPAPHASTGMCAENMKLIVVQTLAAIDPMAGIAGFNEAQFSDAELGRL